MRKLVICGCTFTHSLEVPRWPRIPSPYLSRTCRRLDRQWLVPRTRFSSRSDRCMERLGLFRRVKNAHGAESASRRYVCVDGFVGMVRRGLHRVGRQTPRLFFARDHWRKMEQSERFSEGRGHRCRFLAHRPRRFCLCTALALHATKGGQSIRFLLPQNQLEIFLGFSRPSRRASARKLFSADISRDNSGAWTGNVSAGVLLSAAAFGVGHIYQGWRSAGHHHCCVWFAVWDSGGVSKELAAGMITHAWHDGFAGLAARLIAK